MTSFIRQSAGRPHVVACIAGAVMLTAAPAFSQCQPAWSAIPHTRSGTAFAVHDEDGDGPTPPMLFIGGVGEIGVNRGTQTRMTAVNLIARGDTWDWHPLGEGLQPWPPRAMFGVPATISPSLAGLYVGGEFSHSGQQSIKFVVRWTSSGWEQVGVDVQGPPKVFAMYDEPDRGSVVMAADLFRRTIGEPDLVGVSRWDGVQWSMVGKGLWKRTPTNATTHALLDVLATGSGLEPGLYVGGAFDLAGDLPASSIARWDGTTWSTVGELGIESGTVDSLCVFDAGDGPMLYVGGSFQRVGGPSNWITAPRLARWDGEEWSAVPGWTVPGGGNVRVMTVWDDDGDGPNRPALILGGFFNNAAGTNARSIIKWDGQTWDAMNGGVGGFGRVVDRLQVFDDDGDGPNPGGLYIGGVFDTAGGVWSQGLARWGCPLTPPCLADCDFSTGFGVLDVFDFLCFLNRFHAAAPYSCDCDVSAGHGVCDIFDFLCYGQRFQAGCP